MTDLVKRLRNFCVWNRRHSHYDPVPVCQEAADEIERLRAAMHAAFLAMCAQRDSPDDEVFQDAIDALGAAAS